MGAKTHHPFYHTVSVLAQGLADQQGKACDIALLIAAEIAATQDAPVGRKLLSPNSVNTETVMQAINRHVPDNGTPENAVLRSSLEMVLFRALYDLRHPEIDEPDTIISNLRISASRPEDTLLH